MKRFSHLITLMSCAVILITSFAPAMAAAADDSSVSDADSSSSAADDDSTLAPDTTGYAVKPGLVFNNPKGTKAQQLAIITPINAAIDHAPAGSTIRTAQFLFNIQSTADKLVAAHSRGVHVQMLIHDYPGSSQTAQMRKALGTDKTKRSFVTHCNQSCMASTPSVMHAKFVTFSTSGSSRLVSMISSANIYSGNTYTSWNNNHTIVGDSTIYNSLKEFFNDMLPDKDNLNYYRTTTSGIYRTYEFPRAAKDGVNTIVWLDVLNHVTCTGTAPGYGYKGRTVIRVAQWGWTDSRLDVAKQLWKLHDQGCIVQVIDNNYNTSPTVTATLLKKSAKYGVMRVYTAAFNGNGGVYVHHKVLAINGVWFGKKNTKVVYTGSPNLSNPATRSNNELMLRVLDDATYNAYAANLSLIRDKWTKPVTKAAATSPALEAQLEANADSDSSDD